MKLLSLNICGGMRGKILFDYLQQQSPEVDIFCLQEVFNSPESLALTQSHGARVHLFAELAGLLPSFHGFFAEGSRGHDFVGPVDFELAEGLAIFVKKTFGAKAHKHTPVSSQLIREGEFVAILQELSISAGEATGLNLFNFHGISLPGDKLDSPERLLQSGKIKQIVDADVGPKILCGDFNLMPETKCILMLEQKMNNLIKTFNIQNTRNEISWNKYANR